MNKLEIEGAVRKRRLLTDRNSTEWVSDEADANSTPQEQLFSSIADPSSDPHINGEYFKKNPTWHIEYSSWKADNIHRLLERKDLHPKMIADVGCGAGEVLRHLQSKLDPDCSFRGYDIAPQAIEMARLRENGRLHFEVADFGRIKTPHFDLLLVLEVVDHVEDYLGFLRMLRPKADLKLFSFSLDISAQSALREGAFLQRRETHSHLHHFNKETALSTLQHTGYEIIDYFYPSNLAISSLAVLAKPVRTFLFSLAPDLAVRMLGGYSLLILAR
jgi:2-polyprenyl-3-methyl-5-hydroxy-6-metoxy-1,4-benzoquinol methylase